MKYLLTLLLILCSLSVQAEKPIIEYSIEIYQATKADLIDEPVKDILSNSTLLHSPRMRVYVGEAASIEFGDEKAKLKLEVKSDQAGEAFSFEVSSKSSSDGGWDSLTMSAPYIVLGNTLLLKGEIAEETYLFQIFAKKAED